MKKNLISAFCAAAALFAAGCSDNIAENVAPEASGETIRMSVNGVVPSEDTRALLGDMDENNTYPVLWQQSGEKLYIAENATTAYSSDDEYEVSDEKDSARFTFDIAKTTGSSFQYMAISPYDAVVRVSGLLSEVTFMFPKMQTPQPSSADPAGVILFGKSGTFDSQPSHLDLHLSHIGAYAKMTVKGIPEGEKLLSVKVNAMSQNNAPTPLTGRYYYNFAVQGQSYTTSSGWNNEVVIDAANLEADGAGNYDVWFATMPTSDISTLGVSIYTDKTVYTHEYTLKPGFKFQRGIVSRFSVTVQQDAGQEIPDEYKIVYTSTDGEIVNPANVVDFGENLNIVSNTYAGGSGTIVFSGSVEKIGDSAFKDCATLKSIEITDGVTSVGTSAFTNCSALESVKIPSSVTKIDYTAFSECSALTEVTIPENVTLINTYAFKNCSSLSVVHCTPTAVPSLGWFAFDGIAADAKIYVPASAYELYIKQGTVWSRYESIITPEN